MSETDYLVGQGYAFWEVMSMSASRRRRICQMKSEKAERARKEAKQHRKG